MDSTCVRKDFYLDPPAKGSPPEAWEVWLKADRKEAAKAKAAYTRSLKAVEMPAHLNGTATRKINGVWRSTTAIGFTGSAEDGTGQAEAIVEPTQERDFIRARLTGVDRGKGKSGAQKRDSHRAKLKAAKLVRRLARKSDV